MINNIVDKLKDLPSGTSVGVDFGDGVSATATTTIYADGAKVVLIVPQRPAQTLIISGNLPSRNEADKAFGRHYQKGAEFKRTHTELVFFSAKSQRIKPVDGKAHICITFYEATEKRDPDNIIGGALKYILDGLVNAGVIQNDTRRYVDLAINPIITDRAKPRIEVIITGVLKNGR